MRYLHTMLRVRDWPETGNFFSSWNSPWDETRKPKIP
jgi:hypothetical protein